MPPKKKVRHGSMSTVPEEVQHDPFMPRHPPDEHECDKLIAKRLIAVEHVILIAGFKEHGVAKLLDFYKLRPFMQLTQECYPTPVRVFYSNIRNVDEEKYSFPFTPHILPPIHVAHHNNYLPPTHSSIVVNLPIHSKIFTAIIVNSYYRYNANKVCFSYSIAVSF